MSTQRHPNEQCCPACGGTAGHQHEMTETHVMCGAWGEQAEAGDHTGRVQRSLVTCIDCGVRFQFDALTRKGLL